MLPNPRHRVYKSLETDEEFRARLLARLGERARKYWEHDINKAAGEFLDQLGWQIFNQQRKIIERES